MMEHDDECPYIPDPATYEAEKQAIQQGWSAKERMRRAGHPTGKHPPVEVKRAKEPGFESDEP